MMKKYVLGVLLASVLLSACNEVPRWEHHDLIQIKGISPIGIVPSANGFWLSDSDHNRLVEINSNGRLLMDFGGFERPMHLSQKGDSLVVTEYISDEVSLVKEGVKKAIKLPQSPDAPAGVDVFGERIAVADFYNHRIIYTDGSDDLTFGEKGKEDGKFHYPTDVQFANGKLYVADAYNNRVQVFDLVGKHLQTIGEDEKMNATTGIYVSSDWIIATDFELDRVLTYSLDGELVHILDEGLDKPTDVLLLDGKLYVLNYGGQYISVYQ